MTTIGRSGLQGTQSTQSVGQHDQTADRDKNVQQGTKKYRGRLVVKFFKSLLRAAFGNSADWKRGDALGSRVGTAVGKRMARSLTEWSDRHEARLMNQTRFPVYSRNGSMGFRAAADRVAGRTRTRGATWSGPGSAAKAKAAKRQLGSALRDHALKRGATEAQRRISHFNLRFSPKKGHARLTSGEQKKLQSAMEQGVKAHPKFGKAVLSTEDFKAIGLAALKGVLAERAAKDAESKLDMLQQI